MWSPPETDRSRGDDLADDIAYSVHDMEDGVVGGWFTLDPSALALDDIAAVAGDGTDTSIDVARVAAALERLEAMAGVAPGATSSGVGRRARCLCCLTSA